jgi:hypothetical protein
MTNPYRQPLKPAFNPQDAKAAIFDALSAGQFNWRSVGALAKAAGGIDEDDARALLDDMPEVRRSRGQKEVYGLTSRIG